ncbi:Uncharacterised protein r2_g69 [Pycnogonum litorale]
MGKGKEKTPDPQQPQLMAVSTDRLQTMVEEALRRISQDHEVPIVPPEPRPSSAPVDVLASSQPALPELLTRLRQSVDDKKYRKRDEEEARILLLWSGHTGQLSTPDAHLLAERVRLLLIVAEHGWNTAIADQQLRNPTTSDLQITDLALEKDALSSTRRREEEAAASEKEVVISPLRTIIQVFVKPLLPLFLPRRH